MKIIFLDIDGVLCTSRSHLSKHGRGGLMDEWDDVGALAIYRACKFGENVKIVVSSTWRKFCLNPRDNSDILGVRLAQFNLTQFLHTDWRTKELNGIRGHEIAKWMEEHPNATDYIILDDDSDFLKHQYKNLIRTDFENGLTYSDIKKILTWSGAFDVLTSDNDS